MNFLEAIFRAVVDVSWRSSFLIVAVLALRTALRGSLPGRWLFWAWIIVAIRLLAPFTVQASWSPFTFPSWEDHARGSLSSATQQALPGSRGADESLIRDEQPATHAAVPFPSPHHFTPLQWAALIWVAGAVALLLAKLIAYVRFVRALRRSPPTPSQLLDKASRLSSLARVEVRITRTVSAPALYGIFRPQLLFPMELFEALSPRELRLVVAHELAHHRRRDLPAHVLIYAAVIVHWFNPLAWVIAHIARDDCELACDESVLQRLSESARETYGTTLLKIVTLVNCSGRPPLGLGVVDSKQHLTQRLQMIINPASPALARSALGFALLLVVTGFSLTRETSAQPSATREISVIAPTQLMLANEPSSPPPKTGIVYNPATEGLDRLFANGVVATIRDKVITVDDVRREMKSTLPILEKEALDQDDFNVRFTRQQNQVIRLLIERLLLVSEFNQHKDTTGEKNIPSEYVERAIIERIQEEFNNDRGKFLEYLKARRLTRLQYRREVEEEIIFRYMKGQERKLDAGAKATTPNSQLRARTILLERAEGETDALLLNKANLILTRLKNGETFAALAREFSQDVQQNRGGDWGWLRLEDFKPEFRDLIAALKPGELTAPIVKPQGCFLIFIEERK